MPSASTTPSGHVFISYPRDGGTGEQWAARLQDALEARGVATWRDETHLEAGRPWPRSLATAVAEAAAVVCLVTERTEGSHWIDEELASARGHDRPIVPVKVAPCDWPFGLATLQGVDFTTGAEAKAWEALHRALADLARPADTPARKAESEYLEALLRRKEAGAAEGLYTALAGERRREESPGRLLPEPFMPVSLLLERQGPGAEPREARGEPERLEDVLEALEPPARRPRLVLLGEPGAGKTFSLWRIAARYAHRALDDPAAPLPLLVALNRWIDPDEPLDDFLARELGPIAAYLPALLDAGRALLLLDALNEVPADQRAAKGPQVRGLVQDGRPAAAVVSCRERDYRGPVSLDLDRLTLQPLDPPRVHAFVTRYLAALDPAHGRERGEALFWRLAGGEAVRDAWRAWQKAGADLDLFWSVEDIRREHPNVWDKTTVAQDEAWRQARHDTRSLVRLGGNPYLLNLMLWLWVKHGPAALTGNRAALFERAVADLLLRERQRHRRANGCDPPGEAGLVEALGRLAWRLQAQGPDPEGSVRTVLPRAQADAFLAPAQLDHAVAASLLEADRDSVRFPHQLLQEHFAAGGLQEAVDRGTAQAQELWPSDRWWQPSGWEEVAVLAAGRYADATPLLDWLAPANPAVAVDVARRAGVSFDRGFLERLRARWLPRLDDLALHAEPEARLAIGDALGTFCLDRRPGVHLTPSGLPDIAWVEVPAGSFVYQDGERRDLPAFQIARYPITNAQFLAFVEDGGYREDRWWEGLARHYEAPEPPGWSGPNRPRETVSWYEAVAFCRWLSDKLGQEVRLPTELEWEKAARGMDGRE